MPNLAPPVTTADAADAYAARIRAALPAESGFTPLMTCYLTDRTDPDDLIAGYRRGAFLAAKLYPAHATTNSAAGVTGIDRIRTVLERMQDADMVLCIHGEATDPAIDVFDRERRFVDTVLAPLRQDFPGLRIVLEHVTTTEAVDYVRESEPGIAATITPHHLIWNRNALFLGGLRPDAYCLPVLKRESHRQSLVRAAVSGHERFFLGTDSAPHARAGKENACGCAGIFSAPVALEAYADLFDRLGALDRLEAFASLNGAAFYRLPVNAGTVTLARGPMPVPERVADAAGGLVPFLGGQTLGWRLVP
jgi:dihydroorotase